MSDNKTTDSAPKLGVVDGSRPSPEETLKKLFRRDKRLYCYCFRQAVYHFRMHEVNPTREQTDIVAAWYAETLIEVLDEYAAEDFANTGYEPRDCGEKRKL